MPEAAGGLPTALAGLPDPRARRGIRHRLTVVMTVRDQATGVVLVSIYVDGNTNEITRFAPLLDKISDLRGTVITAMPCTAKVGTSPTSSNAAPTGS
ncbi:hypothetical protein [Micromonospora ureilytica]|uniref:hypothetical protein n=1 Tax=Micromonospora ureilytica TaxID=709868 RepID=UPI00403A321A